MSTLDERVAFLEGRVQEHSHGLSELREMVVHLDQKLDRRLDGVDRRFDALDQKLDRSIAAVHGRIDTLAASIDGRFDAVDHTFSSLDQKIGRLDERMTRQVFWILGVQVAVLLAVIGALAGS